MDVDYKKLWIRLIDRGIKNKTELIPLAGISTNILAKLSKGEFISMESLKKICIALDCDIGDIVSFRENSFLGQQFFPLPILYSITSQCH